MKIKPLLFFRVGAIVVAAGLTAALSACAAKPTVPFASAPPLSDPTYAAAQSTAASASSPVGAAASADPPAALPTVYIPTYPTVDTTTETKPTITALVFSRWECNIAFNFGELYPELEGDKQVLPLLQPVRIYYPARLQDLLAQCPMIALTQRTADSCLVEALVANPATASGLLLSIYEGDEGYTLCVGADS
ncbi:MAG: hypothetical protein FWF49_05030 [Oscillospiraceae bacterium]|nr:hypothetical protein [Oscillospiraceae bacterium]